MAKYNETIEESERTKCMIIMKETKRQKRAGGEEEKRKLKE